MKIRELKIPFTKTSIDSTAVLPGVRSYEDLYGVYCFAAKQGAGKTYSAVRWLLSTFVPNADWRIYTNLKSAKFRNIYLNDIDEILANRDKNVVIFVDEIFKKIDYDRRKIKQFTEWLGQSRKHFRVVIFTTQEWLDLPIEIRRFCRRSITIRRSWFGLRVATWGDSENMVYDQIESQYVCPVVHRVFFRINKRIASLYDTLEAIE